MTVLILIRHCASSGQAPEADRFVAGRTAAEALADRLSGLGIDAVYSSPYRRALSTIEPFALRHALPLAVDDRLKERVLADHDRQDWLRHVERSFEDGEHRLSGGESFNAVRHRGLAALAQIVSRDHRLPIAASHGALISAVLSATDPTFGFDQWRALRNPDLFELSFSGGSLQSWKRLE